MKRVLALTAGVLVALAPTGTAFAGVVPGNAYGNCNHSSSGGDAHTALMPEVGNGEGNGGLVELGKGEGGCVTTTVIPPVDDGGTTGGKGPTVPGRGGGKTPTAPARRRVVPAVPEARRAPARRASSRSCGCGPQVRSSAGRCPLCHRAAWPARAHPPRGGVAKQRDLSTRQVSLATSAGLLLGGAA